MNHTQTYQIHTRGTKIASITTNLGEIPDAGKNEYVGELISNNVIKASEVHHIWLRSTLPVFVRVLKADGEVISEVDGVRLHVAEFDSPCEVEVSVNALDSAPLVSIQTISKSLSIRELV